MVEQNRLCGMRNGRKGVKFNYNSTKRPKTFEVQIWLAVKVGE